MKLTKKKVFVVALAVCLIAIISMSTLAWFTASDEAENIFKVSTDDQTQKPDFKLDLFEHEADEDGKISDTEVDANTYDNIAPGDVLYKDPTVRNDGQYDMWVRVKVTLTGYDKWQAILGTGYDFRKILSGVSTDWSFDTIETDATAKTLTLVYYKDAKLAVGDTSTLFTNVNIPTEFTVDNMPTEFNLNVVAEAIQADNTGNNAKDAFTAYWGE